MLYPQLNKCRELFSLNGIWKYKTIDEDFVPYLPIDEYMLMAVPASVNDIVTDSAIRDYVGKFLFETDFSFPFIVADTVNFRCPNEALSIRIS